MLPCCPASCQPANDAGTARPRRDALIAAGSGGLWLALASDWLQSAPATRPDRGTVVAPCPETERPAAA
ncbi:hypothetical protein JYK14_05870 [Siccirubricoccus sp. KC 17139]|uniref:Twin-arginine translocation signal domain-containing protein n=1 Tax=Siccirubricoccus soli TaxID=2899147 RepID=A0ABT1D351_9PROT|nr:hypothetical protein [Siccirubricoccus soli]MCO6415705.1 hypothetical protein [Siccirubricoccus soli]MCP2681837.1 hypothetical protein [Siccirubricoccus soli]